MKSIGGFFELELSSKKEFYPNLLKLNTSRNSLEYILRVRKYKRIYLPNYICDSVLQPILKLKIEYEFYHIDKNFKPLLSKELLGSEVILYVNYFGINDVIAKQLSKIYKNIIIDNSQAFFSKPFKNIDTIYSPRKFFGVSDGSYLYTNQKLNTTLKQDNSTSRFKYLLDRIDLSPEDSYQEFLKNEIKLNNQPIKTMSHLTQRMLQSFDYKNIKTKRIKNFTYLHKKLSKINSLKINIKKFTCPMVYPFFCKKKKLRNYLIDNKIYVATYWKDALKRVNDMSFEYNLVEYLVPLPIDQRYGSKDMDIIIKKIKRFYEK